MHSHDGRFKMSKYGETNLKYCVPPLVVDEYLWIVTPMIIGDQKQVDLRNGLSNRKMPS